jgi:hypothetical protein
MAARRWGVLVLAGLLFLVSRPAPAQTKAPPDKGKPAPRLEAVAETRLIMDGLADANYRGLEKMLKQPPPDVEAWTYVRGQALLVGETGNLLMLRPPRGGGQEVWMQRSTELREAGTALARHAANRDYERSRAGLRDVAAVCNRCHQNFRVPVQVGEAP